MFRPTLLKMTPGRKRVFIGITVRVLQGIASVTGGSGTITAISQSE